MKLFVTIPGGPVRDTFIPPAVRARMESEYEVVWNETGHDLTADDLAGRLSDIDIVVPGWGSAKYTRDVLDRAPRLKAIAYTGGSVAPVVDDAAYRRGIRVLSGNDLYARSVAESVVCYALASLRRIPQFVNQVQQEGWARPGWYNEGLLDQRVGLVGFGAVARHAARLLRAFGCGLLIAGADHVTDEEAASYGARKATLEEVFSACKIVSLHWAKTPETYHAIDERLLSLLHPDSLLINTARGAIIDEPVMARMLREGRFRAALDVYEQEPLPADSPLRGLDNALLIPHMGGPTIDRRPFVTQSLLNCLPAALSGEATPLDISEDAMRRMTR